MSRSKLAYEKILERLRESEQAAARDPARRVDPMPDTLLSGLRQLVELMALVIPPWFTAWWALSLLRVDIASASGVRLGWNNFWPELLFIVPFLGQPIRQLLIRRCWRSLSFRARAKDAWMYFREVWLFYGLYLFGCALMLDWVRLARGRSLDFAETHGLWFVPFTLVASICYYVVDWNASSSVSNLFSGYRILSGAQSQVHADAACERHVRDVKRRPGSKI